MLIRFSLENWQSFRNPTSFSMIASKERQHKERLANIGNRTRILPIAVLYGGNASGKTNFFHALRFAKSLVVRGTQPDSVIPVDTFMLDPVCADHPTRLSFELLIEEQIYALSFVVTRKAVLEEKLELITNKSEKILYYRLNGKPNFGDSLRKDRFLDYAFKGTRENQLFLTNTVLQNIDTFRQIYDWFKNTLELIAPDSRFGPFEQFLSAEHPLYAAMNQMLQNLDTGIEHLEYKEIPFENIPFSHALKSKLHEEIQEGSTVRLLGESNRAWVVTRKANELRAMKLATCHRQPDGGEVHFEIRQESDGALRLIDLLPVFLELSSQTTKKVYVIDECDRSLHTLITRRLLEDYLASCSADSRRQLLLTSHDVLLLDKKLFRCDEMWVTEKDGTGASTLTSLSEYKDVRSDTNLRKSYLQGRLGGTPRILLKEW
ncbi:MAG: ATP-binding protein [Desulfovibrio sp.]|nr:ATP-binding protein [Desulfovibrio sp.]